MSTRYHWNVPSFRNHDRDIGRAMSLAIDADDVRKPCISLAFGSREWIATGCVRFPRKQTFDSGGLR
jgi:hypothetical protein